MTSKPIFSPSALSAYESCKYAYKLLWEDYLDLPQKINPQPTLGTFLHVLQATYEIGGDELKAIGKEIKKIKRAPGYAVKDHGTLDQLKKEALLIHTGGAVKDGNGKITTFPGYPEYRKDLVMLVAGFAEPVSTIDVEERLFVDLGPIIAVPKLDMVIETEESGEMWVVEWKSTMRDDSAWANRWLMDGQTTLQVLAAEKHYDREVKGLLVLPIIYGRKNAPKGRQDRKSIIDRPITKVSRPEPRWVPKNSPALRANFMAHLEDLAKDYKWRKEALVWPTNGMHTRACDFCGFSGICAGQDSPKRLVPKSYRDLKDIREEGGLA